jgi:uncharacterized iron-regulated protein
MNNKVLLAAAAGMLAFSACKKDDKKTTTTTTVEVSDVLKSVATNVYVGTYNDLHGKTQQLRADIDAFTATPNSTNLEKCRNSWKVARSAWEQSESFLFGPVSTENIDPRIDTWPVDYNALDSVMNTANPLTETYVDGLPEGLKGFHPIEYLLFGLNGQKAPGDFSTRQREFLVGLAQNMQKLTQALASGWDMGNATSYYGDFTTAGVTGNNVYSTRRQAMVDAITAMAEICGEVADAKIKEPFDAQDPSLEESPFSGNSMIDFTNNINGVMNVYLGKYNGVDGIGIEDWMKLNNAQLDSKIKTAHANAINALNSVTVKFGDAITTQKVQLQNAMTAIAALQTVLEDEALPFVKQKIVN